MVNCETAPATPEQAQGHDLRTSQVVDPSRFVPRVEAIERNNPPPPPIAHVPINIKQKSITFPASRACIDNMIPTLNFLARALYGFN
jgi:hypothetical protein